MQRMQPELGRVSPNAFQVQPKSFSYSAVTYRLLVGNQLTRTLPSRAGSKKEKTEVWRNLKFRKIPLSNLTGHAQLESSEVMTSPPRRSWSFLLFDNFNNLE